MTKKIILRSLRKRIMSLMHTKRSLEKKIIKKNGVIVLMYHSVSDPIKEYPYSINHDNFEAQMKFIKKNFNCLDIKNIVNSLNAGSENNNNPNVCVTFDDGYRDNIDIAYPILKKYNIPFTIFLTTSFIDSTNKTFLDWEDIKRLSDDPLITFGAHSVLHANFTSLDINDVKNELINSKNNIEKQINNTVDYCAYPYGGYNEKIKQFVKNLYKGALLDRQTNNEFDIYSIPRISIDKNNEAYKKFLLTLTLSKFY